jgi:predicted XRE-type DNA-binding protein
MKKRTMSGIEFTRSSKNVYADLGLPEADKLKVKTDLVIQIMKAMERLELTQAEAAKRMGISQPKVSAMMHGDFSNLSERKLMDCLTHLGYNVEIRIKPVRSLIGSLRVALA